MNPGTTGPKMLSFGPKRKTSHRQHELDNSLFVRETPSPSGLLHPAAPARLPGHPDSQTAGVESRSLILFDLVLSHLLTF